MSEQNYFESAAARAGWDSASREQVLLEYIGNQGSSDVFRDFLEEKMAQEASMCDDAEPSRWYYWVGVREVHISYRLLIAERRMTRDEVVGYAMDLSEISLDYSHTMDSEHVTVEEVDEKFAAACYGINVETLRSYTANG